MSQFDLIIRGGTIVDGNGGVPIEGDVAIRDGKILEVGLVSGTSHEEIDARGKLVTPGFVDIHTHYDGQITWSERLSPSSTHGVTTVIMGNCGVGFSPCKPEDRAGLIRLLEGVEDIPEIVMTEGLPWNWESFESYLDAVSARVRDIDVAAMLPHACLRVYVMGERAAAQEEATAEDIAQMRSLAADAVRAGAIGFGTSRTIFHRDRNGFRDSSLQNDVTPVALQFIRKLAGRNLQGVTQQWNQRLAIIQVGRIGHHRLDRCGNAGGVESAEIRLHGRRPRPAGYDRL